MAYNITSQSQLIDITTINNGCAQIEAAAEKFAECAKLVSNASSICDAKALSVDKTTIQPQLDEDANYILSMETAIKNFSKEIKNVAVQVYSAQSQELANYNAQAQKNSASNSN